VVRVHFPVLAWYRIAHRFEADQVSDIPDIEQSIRHDISDNQGMSSK